MIGLRGLTLEPDEAEALRHPLIGGVILFTRNYLDIRQLGELVRSIRAIRSDPPLIAVDQEGGRVQRFRKDFTPLPALRWIGQIYEADRDHARHLAFSCAWVMATELLDVGIDLSFAPVVDLDRGISEIIGERALHSEPAIVADLATSYVQGMHNAGMAATAKHFPGHGAVAADSHHDVPIDTRTRQEIEEDLKPYHRLIRHGLEGIMVAHVRYPAVDPQIASLSHHWLRTELRDGLGFDGVIFSDDLSMAAAAVGGAVPDRVRAVLAAGADMALVCNDPQAIPASLEALLGYSAPVSAGRLQALRGRPRTAQGALLRDSIAWQQATRLVIAAFEQSAAQGVG